MTNPTNTQNRSSELAADALNTLIEALARITNSFEALHHRRARMVEIAGALYVDPHMPMIPRRGSKPTEISL
jgi:hypothetical protein